MSQSNIRTRIALLAALSLITGQAAAQGNVLATFGDTCIASGTSYDKAMDAVNARKPTRLPDDPSDAARGPAATTTWMLGGATPVLVTLNQRGYCAVMADASEEAGLQSQLAAFMAGLKDKPAIERKDARSPPGAEVLAFWEVDWSPELAMYVRLVKGSADGVEGVMVSRAFVAK